MVEYAQGNDGALLQKEAYSYVLDALLMIIVSGCFAWFHPSNVLKKEPIVFEDQMFQENGGARESRETIVMGKVNGFTRI